MSSVDGGIDYMENCFSVVYKSYVVNS